MAEHIQVFNPSSGKPYATAPTPKNSDGTINISDSSSKIATTEWVSNKFNSTGGNYLPLSGGTITGNINAINVTDTLTLKNSNISQYDTSRSQDYYYIPVKIIDKNNRIIGALEAHTAENGTNRLDLHMQCGHGNTSEYLTLNILDNVDGTRSIDFCGCETFLHPGFVIAFAGNWDPIGLLPCNGGLISRTTYKRLFDSIGTTYGEGDGSTTFALPNLDGRFVHGSGTSGSYINAGLPNIVGSPGVYAANIVRADGCFSPTFYPGNLGQHFSNTWNFPYGDIQFNAAGSNGVYGASATVQPPALTMRYYIKY